MTEMSWLYSWEVDEEVNQDKNGEADTNTDILLKPNNKRAW